jgi:hypothetical protein
VADSTAEDGAEGTAADTARRTRLAEEGKLIICHRSGRSLTGLQIPWWLPWRPGPLRTVLGLRIGIGQCLMVTDGSGRIGVGLRVWIAALAGLDVVSRRLSPKAIRLQQKTSPRPPCNVGRIKIQALRAWNLSQESSK